MPKSPTETEQKRLFIARTKAARVARFPTQGPICTLLDIPQGTYKQYETRTPLPHRYIPKFCAACGVEMEWLLAGTGEGPAIMQHVPKIARGRARKQPRKVA